MNIDLQTYNDHVLNSSDYETMLLNPHSTTSAAPVFIDQAEADSQDSGTYTVARQTKVLRVFVKNYANRYALIAQLKTWFKRGTRGALVGTFLDDGIDYQLDCRVASLVPDPESGLYYTVMLETGNSAWRAVTADTESIWTVTGTSETVDVTVGGKDETFLNVEITAKSGPATGYLYQNLYRLPNTPNIRHGLVAWCITVNTAALVAAGKMQADCDDLRIVDLNTGQELKRWIDTPNNASTKVWVNLNFTPGSALPLSTSVASSGLPAYLQFTVAPTTKKSLSWLPPSGIVYHGNEWFAYNRVDAANCRLYLSARKLFGTTEEAHTAGATFYFIQYPLLMKYGNSSVASPSSTDEDYDDTKPLIDLNLSSNTTWVWNTTTLFYDSSHPNRTCGWSFGRAAKGANSKAYYVKQDAETGDPALGLKAASYQLGSVWKDETVNLTALFRRAATITTVSMTGSKYRSNANWLLLAALRRSVDGVNYINLWTEATPTSALTWTAWTHNSVSVATGSVFLQLILNGGYKAGANAYAAFEALTCTVVFASGNIPTGAFLGETNAYPLVLTIENITDDDYSDAIGLDYIMLIDKTFMLDGEQKTAVYDSVNVHSALTPDDLSRSAFIRLKGGATNTIQISGSDLGEIDVVLSYYRRRL